MKMLFEGVALRYVACHEVKAGVTYSGTYTFDAPQLR